MTDRSRCCLSFAIVACMLGLGAQVALADAGMIGTDEARSAQSERERVKALVARPEVAKKIQALGVLPENARARVDALTDEEIAALAGRIDALPAGGVSDRDWLLAVLLILLLFIIL